MVVTYTVTGTATSGTDYTARERLVDHRCGRLDRDDLDSRPLDDSVLDPGETLIGHAGREPARRRGPSDRTAPTAAMTTITDTGTATVSVGPGERRPRVKHVEFVVTLSMARRGATRCLAGRRSADTATSGDDYTAVTAGTLTIAAGDTTGTLAVATAQDRAGGGRRDLHGDDHGHDAAFGRDPGHDDRDRDHRGRRPDQGKRWRDAATVTEGGAAQFTVTLTSASSTADVVVTYTVGGTTTSGTDYTAPSGSLTITAGESSGTITIRTTSDSVLDCGRDVDGDADRGEHGGGDRHRGLHHGDDDDHGPRHGDGVGGRRRARPRAKQSSSR